MIDTDTSLDASMMHQAMMHFHGEMRRRGELCRTFNGTEDREEPSILQWDRNSLIPPSPSTGQQTPFPFNRTADTLRTFNVKNPTFHINPIQKIFSQNFFKKIYSIGSSGMPQNKKIVYYWSCSLFDGRGGGGEVEGREGGDG